MNHKTAYYSFYLPVALAMHFCGIPQEDAPDRDPYKLAQDILIPLGHYFQVRDDWLDYSGMPEQTGKIGTDIVDNKCSWCIITALAVATPAQRKILYENYGQKDAAKEQKVKEVYEQVDLRARYIEYEEVAYERLTSLIDTIADIGTGGSGSDPVLKRAVFTTFLDKIYKRTN